jgi:AcrR family transcriptional regulator
VTLEETGTPRVGRPRRFAPEEERLLLLDAGFRVMRRNGFADATVADILEQAGVSSRAFYRHFDSKDALLLALFRRDADRVVASLRDVVGAAGHPGMAVEAWLDGYLDIFFERRRAARASLMSSEGARRAVGYDAELRAVEQRLAEPLAGALRVGRDAGVLRSADPDCDAMTVLAVASSVCVPFGPSERPGREDARRHITRFCWPALGLPHP